ncbi:MAG: hypothetical protein M1820_004882 [Bogoriella megaspora]|nr:MAG: hypothetical protein M1820_004882 [Bogoriella megaspora]
MSTPPSSPEDADPSFLISESLIPSRPAKRAGITETDFDGLLPVPLKLHEDLRNGCGGQLWPAGRVLAAWLLRRRGLVERRRVVELGAGGGVVGLSVALSCAISQPIWITDQEPMYDLMKTNIELNSLGPSVRPAIYDWGSPPPHELPEHVDVVLAADCVYFEPAFPLLLQTLNDLIQEGTICYFCFKKRRRADLGFIKEMRKRFEVKEIEEEERDGVGWRREGIFL